MRILPVLPFVLACIGAHAADLTVRLSGVARGAGNIKISLYASGTAYDAGQPLNTAKLPADGELKTVFTGLAAGQYAVIAYHDINRNEKLDRDGSGMPLEPYGFSQNPPSRLGKPAFSAAAVTIDKHDSGIEIVLE